MKITGMRYRQFEHELSRPLADANFPRGAKSWASGVLFLDTDAGISGVTLTGTGMQGQLQGLVERILLGRDPRGVRGLWFELNNSVFKGGNRGAAGDAISALDVALWDLKAKANGEPLWKTLGASSRYVKAYASDIGLCLSEDELYAFYRGMAERGVNAGKLKVGLDRDKDLQRLALMHEALSTSGKKPLLMIDSNEYWSAKQAIRNIHYLEERFELFWVEEPARRWDYRGLREVRQSVRAAVATCENLDDISEFRPLIEHGAVDVVQISAGNSGLTGAMNVAALALGFDLPVSMMNCPGNYTAHLAAALSNHNMMEVVEAGREQVFTHDTRIDDGYIVLGDAPGLGIVFDEAKLQQFAIDKPSGNDLGAASSGRRRGAGLFEVTPAEPDWLPQE